MAVALVDFVCEHAGETSEFYAGVSHVADGHEVARRYPDRFAPAESRAGRQAINKVFRRSAPPSPFRERPAAPAHTRSPSRDWLARSWRLEPSPRRGPWRLDDPSASEPPRVDPTDFDVQRMAAHEAAHATAAYLLGWEVTGIRLHRDGSGGCLMLGPERLEKGNLDERKLFQRQLATIAYTARAHNGWTSNKQSYNGDDRQAYKALQRLTSHPLDTQRLVAEVRHEAKQLAQSEKFRWIAKYVAEELLEAGGQIDERAIGPLLREAERAHRRRSYL
jgi:hypothetical protein